MVLLKPVKTKKRGDGRWWFHVSREGWSWTLLVTLLVLVQPFALSAVQFVLELESSSMALRFEYSF